MKAKTLQNEEFRRKATVHLNNAGVALLHCGDLRPAIETFTDALTVANLACRANNIKTDPLASPTGLTQHDSVDIRKYLEKAYDRLSDAKTSKLSNIDLKIISDDQNLASIHSRCLAEREMGSSMDIGGGNFVIHTEHLTVEVLSEEDMAIQCSVISYNYGVACLCLSTHPTSRPIVDKLYTGALKMFELAFSTLTSYHLTKDKLKSHQMNRVLITSLFAIRNLILLSATLGMAKERDEYLQRLVDLKQSFYEFCHHHHHAFPSPATCAAWSICNSWE